MDTEWISVRDDIPERGNHVWLYDSMFGKITSTVIAFDPTKLDADYSHWMLKKSSTMPKPPADGKVHAKL
jgi:hypothetical protein